MREEYHVTLYSQMGPREGRLDLQYEGSAVTGSLELMGRRNPVGRLPDAMGGEPDLP